VSGAPLTVTLDVMKRIYSAWAKHGSSLPNCLAEGIDPPRFNNGDVDPDCQVRLWTIEVGSLEEALAIRNLRCGWEPYEPEGEAEPCPTCGAMHYPMGSGQCWQCDHQC
jgi:hypothetical protein